MSRPCEFLATCGFFRRSQGSSDALIQSWVRIFCDSTAKAQECERKRYRETRGEDPPDNMAPTGRLL